MVDVVDKATRSRLMAGIRGKDTKPELVIRKGLHGRGFRYRLHDKRLPGKPDLVLPKYRAVIQVQGCFWHGHDCALFKWPSTRQDFWRQKITGNQARDQRNLAALEKLGWRSLTIWECSLKGPGRLPLDKILTWTADWLRLKAASDEIRGADQVRDRPL
ncbi:MAG: DNA mismatch endonuclease Vsr [Alphaproteobacteria bacterium]|nr:DNA mismatch endonuclease Vsr [Alphaproteobacteria bacterium]MBT4084022.1 DNA mismatch endonuclease Vsr [Alphaproteobacteria bacterium]MBT4542250.1 DNA mismatch endonuclease Vsr [Alphaproteobacteria bacterium]MBT7747812.1 DNA mismatch endonuclease Vsr [Alphaproteobacteria bacterium]